MWLVATVLDNAALESIVDSFEITKQREFSNIFQYCTECVTDLD